MKGREMVLNEYKGGQTSPWENASAVHLVSGADGIHGCAEGDSANATTFHDVSTEIQAGGAEIEENFDDSEFATFTLDRTGALVIENPGDQLYAFLHTYVKVGSKGREESPFKLGLNSQAAGFSEYEAPMALAERAPGNDSRGDRDILLERQFKKTIHGLRHCQQFVPADIKPGLSFCVSVGQTFTYGTRMVRRPCTQPHGKDRLQ